MEEGRLAGIATVESLGYLKKNIAEEKKALVRKRLDELRGGPFGEIRRKAKEKLL